MLLFHGFRRFCERGKSGQVSGASGDEIQKGYTGIVMRGKSGQVSGASGDEIQNAVNRNSCLETK